MTQICIDQYYAFFIIVLITLLLTFVVYTSFSSEQFTQINLEREMSKKQLIEKVESLKEKLHECMVNNEYYKSDLAKGETNLQPRVIVQTNTQPVRDYNSNNNYQQIGIIHNSTGRFPLYGRQKYPNNSSKWEYYTIDESRNMLPIEVKSINFNELYTNDTVNVPILGGTFTISLYEYNNFRYVG